MEFPVEKSQFDSGHFFAKFDALCCSPRCFPGHEMFVRAQFVNPQLLGSWLFLWRAPPRFAGSIPTCYCLPVYHLARMPYRPQKLKKSESKLGEMNKHQFRANQHSDLRHREMSTRSTLSRLRNRKSDLK